MALIVRQLATAAAANPDIRTAQVTEIHWSAPGRVAPSVVAAAPSIHLVWGGRQWFSVDSRPLRLDEQVFLLLNAGHILTAHARRDPSASMLSVFFAPTLLMRALEDLPDAEQRMLCSWSQDGPVQFLEHLRERDRAIDAVTRYIAHHVREGAQDALWCEEQACFLLGRLLAHECQATGLTEASGVRAWKRRDVIQRLGRVTDLIHSAYERPLTIEELGAAAHWSVFHMMREFKAVHGVTPYEFLQRRRTQAAVHLLSTTELSVVEIVEQTGFRDRSTLMRRLRRLHGRGARALRSINRSASAQPAQHRSATSAASAVHHATSISSDL